MRGAHGHGRPPGRELCPGRWWCRRAWTRTCRPAETCSRCSTRPRRSSRASRSTRPSWTWAVCAGCRAPRSRSPPSSGVGSRAEVGLAITVGIARTKFLAKVASGVAKPDGLLLVPPGGELRFLHPLPVQRLWGVGPKTAAKLHERGITTVREVAELPESALVAMLGRGSGHHLHALAHNRDPRRVETGKRRRSIGSQQALGHRHRTPADLDAVLVGLVDRVAAGCAGRTSGWDARWCCGCASATSPASPGRTPCPSPPTRRWWCSWPSGRCCRPSCRASLPRASRCWASRWPTWTTPRPCSWPCRSVATTAARSTPRSISVKERFGTSSVGRTTLVGRTLHPEAPRLPD